MMKKTMKIWIWLHNDQPLKAVCCPEDGTITIYDEQDRVLIKRTGLNPVQMKTIEVSLSAAGAKRIDGKREPFTYL